VSACTRRLGVIRAFPGDESYNVDGRDGKSDIIRARPHELRTSDAASSILRDSRALPRAQPFAIRFARKCAENKKGEGGERGRVMAGYYAEWIT